MLREALAAEVSRRHGSVINLRPNIVVRSTRAVPFEEDHWLGGVRRDGDVLAAELP